MPLVPTDWKTDEEIIYVGDPMCSWCWGLSPQLNALQRYGQQLGIPFSLVMGGLRPGGGEAWNADFKGFLKHHWEEVTQRSGQPFGYGLFDLEDFNYDTEPRLPRSSDRTIHGSRKNLILLRAGAACLLYAKQGPQTGRILSAHLRPTQSGLHRVCPTICHR